MWDKNIQWKSLTIDLFCYIFLCIISNNLCEQAFMVLLLENYLSTDKNKYIIFKSQLQRTIITILWLFFTINSQKWEVSEVLHIHSLSWSHILLTVSFTNFQKLVNSFWIRDLQTSNMIQTKSLFGHKNIIYSPMLKSLNFFQWNLCT